MLQAPVEPEQYLAIRYSDRLTEIGPVGSVGTVGDSYDNALAESVFGLYKTELIRRRGPWRNLDQVEIATLEWVDWYNQRRLHTACGNVPPPSTNSSTTVETPLRQSPPRRNRASTEPGAVQLRFESPATLPQADDSAVCRRACLLPDLPVNYDVRTLSGSRQLVVGYLAAGGPSASYQPAPGAPPVPVRVFARRDGRPGFAMVISDATYSKLRVLRADGSLLDIDTMQKLRAHGM